MHRPNFAVVLVTGLLAGVAPTMAHAQLGSDGSSTAAAAPPANDPNEIVCRKHLLFGSHLMARECHTRREWDQMRIDGRQGLENAQIRGAFGPRH
jgi:hypothetical protein